MVRSNVTKLYPGEAYITLNDKQSKAMADQLTTVSKQRLVNRIGSLSTKDIQQVERAIEVQLGLRLSS